MRTRLLLSLLVLASTLFPTFASADSVLPLDFSSALSGWNQLYSPRFFSCGSSPGTCWQGNSALGQVLSLPPGTYTFSLLVRTLNYAAYPPDIFLYVWWQDARVKPTSTESVGDYTKFTYSGLMTPGGNTDLVLGFSGGCGCLKWNLSTPPPPPAEAPEPATLLLLGTGAAASFVKKARKVWYGRRSG